MIHKILVIVCLLTFLLLSGHPTSFAEPNQETIHGSQSEERILQEKIQKLKKEIRESKDKTSYDILQNDLDKTQNESTALEITLKENQTLKQAKEQEKNELEEQLRIREQQLANDPGNPRLQNEVISINTQLNGKDGKSGLNYAIQNYENKIQANRKALDEIVPQRDRLQNEYDSHSLTQKQMELQSVQEKLTTLQNENQQKRLIEKLNEMNASTKTFPVRKYLSVGHEAEIEFINQGDQTHSLIDRVIQLALQALGTFAILLMIVAGYYLIVSEGDENRIQKGKNIFFYTIVGLLVTFTSYALVQFILSILFH